jgi:hypothetical protein
MAAKIKRGDRVMLEIRSSEVFEGDVEYFSEKSVELYNIFCQATNTEYEGSMVFYRNEVVAISRISESTESDNSLPEKGGFPEELKKIKMHPDEFARLKQMTFDFVFVDTFGPRFKDAVEVLSNRESVAVVGLGSTFTRGKQLSLLMMADFKQVFIFDMFCLVDLKELKEILQSSFICKVVHDGSALFDCLYHKYKVEMKNVFDTQVVDSMEFEQEENTIVKRNLSECLSHHFNFPPSLLSAAMDDMPDKNWLERPIIKSNKIKAAQLITYLLSLRDHLVSKIHQKYTDRIHTEYTKYKHISDHELMMMRNMSLHSSKS